MRRSVATAVCGVLLLSSVVSGGGLDTSKVSAKAKWVAHLDVDGLLSSPFGQHILKEVEARGHAKAIAAFAEKVGFDPTKDLRSFTVWGEIYEPSGGVAVMQGTSDKDKLLKLVSENKGHREAKYGGYALQRWTQKRENKRDDGVRWGTFWADDVVLIARDRKVLEIAIDTLNDKAATLAGQLGVVLGPKASEGAFLIVAAKGPLGPAKLAGKAAIVKKLAAGFLELGEVDGNVFLNISVTAVTETDGEQFRQMLQGILAFKKMSLTHREENKQPMPLWAPLVRAVTIGGEGATVSLSAKMATADVIATLKAVEEAKKAAKEAKKAAKKAKKAEAETKS